MKYLILMLTIMLTGCSTMLDKSSDKVAQSIDRYCAETNLLIRAELRRQVNDKLNGKAKIKIECKGD